MLVVARSPGAGVQRPTVPPPPRPPQQPPRPRPEPRQPVRRGRGGYPGHHRAHLALARSCAESLAQGA